MWSIIKEAFLTKTSYQDLFDAASAYTKVEFRG